MTNQNEHSHEEKCLVCNAYEKFLEDMKMGLSMEEAFRSTVDLLAEDLVETVTDDVSEEAFHFGFVEAMNLISETASKTANKMMIHAEMDKCGCDECNCGIEEDITSEHVELSNEEKLARRRMWESETGGH